MKICPLRLGGAYELRFVAASDARGDFVRWYDAAIFAAAGLPTEWVQANESRSSRGVVRGLHFQRAPHTETKLVRVVAGAIYDAFVDLRRGSPTFGQWEAVELSAEKRNAVLVPKGCAHGFCALEDATVVSYLVDCAYAPAAEGGVLWNDPALGIPWPLAGEVLVSDKDRGLPPLSRVEPL